jgi:hypothetical protein
MTTPIHLSGAECGDHVLWHGQPFGIIHCWAAGGCSVRLDKPSETFIQIQVPDSRIHYRRFTCLEVLVTNEMFTSGDFTVVKDKKE